MSQVNGEVVKRSERAALLGHLEARLAAAPEAESPKLLEAWALDAAAATALAAPRCDAAALSAAGAAGATGSGAPGSALGGLYAAWCGSAAGRRERVAYVAVKAERPGEADHTARLRFWSTLPPPPPSTGEKRAWEQTN